VKENENKKKEEKESEGRKGVGRESDCGEKVRDERK
jgi:hypothetical protein